MKTTLLDLDGTICDTRHRDHMIAANRADTDWCAYSLACAEDRPVPGVVALISRLPGLKIILTGRHEQARRLTERWLSREGVSYDQLLMRPEGDNRENVAFKVAEVRTLRKQGFDIVLAIDDYRPIAEALYADFRIPTVLVARNGVGQFRNQGGKK